MLRHASGVALPALLALLAACAPSRPPDAKGASAPRYFGSLQPPRDDVLRFTLGAEPETIDPGLAVGQPDGRVARILFEGLTRDDPRTLAPLPGQAYRWDVSADRRTYVFHLRPGITWSDGRPVVAGDFRWSWLRVLRPATAARYASMLYPIRNAEGFNQGAIAAEDSVGIAAPDDSTLVVRLVNPTPYFLYLTQFYTYLPVPRRAIERFGDRWTLPGHVVGNGAFTLASWRQNDRFVFRRNPRYWNASAVRLAGLTAYTVEDLNTCTNLYKAGVFDWNPSGYVPSEFVPYLRGYADFRSGDYQGTYFYSMNVTRHPFDNVWVRRALNLAVDRDAIANDLLKRSRRPWGDFTPDGYPGYRHPLGIPFDPATAREDLARAGYPGGHGFPKITILFNTSEEHRRIAEALQAMWKRELGIQVELANMEWGSFLQATNRLDYDIARRSWIGDYLDPYSFLGLGRGGDGNNRTGWRDRRYDALLARATTEPDPTRRFAILAHAESLLLADGPFIPVYHYSTIELVKPWVHGLYTTALDVHPLTEVWIDHAWRPGSPPAMASIPR
jgi:ABC-type oligopeptide transport system substrate-binding subunit